MLLQQADELSEIDIDVARRRARPYLIVLDEELNVVCAERRASELLAQAFSNEKTGSIVPAEVRAAMLEFTGRPGYTANGAEPEVLLSRGMLILRIISMHDESGRRYTTLFVEPHAKREHLRHAGRRYALSKREAEVLDLMLRGYRSAEIADVLCISLATVSDHFKSLLKKTDARSRSEMLVKIFGT